MEQQQRSREAGDGFMSLVLIATASMYSAAVEIAGEASPRFEPPKERRRTGSRLNTNEP